MKLAKKDAIDLLVVATSHAMDIEKVEKAKKTIEDAFPGISIDVVNGTFTGGDKSGDVSLLSSPRTYLKGKDEKTKGSITRAVSWIDNYSNDIKRSRSRAGYIEEFYNQLVSAEKKRPKEIRLAGKPIEMTGSLDLLITGDPLLIALKSSGRGWERMSSAKIFDWLHPEDTLDDVRLGNYAAYVIESGGNPYSRKDVHARIMLRRCGKNGEHIGVERFWYFGNEEKESGKTATNEYVEIAPGLYAANATRFLVRELEKEGLLNYGKCNTAYYYGGYSDAAADHNTQITYDANELFGSLNLDRIDYRFSCK